MIAEPTLDPAQLRRVADALAESGAAVADLAPSVARDYQRAADVLRVVAATLELAPSAAPRPSPTRPADLPKHRAARRAEQEAAAKYWMQIRVLNWPENMPPPSIEADIAAAKDELSAVPQRVIRNHRWPGWRRPPGRPRKIICQN
jgi:hypothetical protein